ncbi:R3H and coiled-coil domain-containing protein 1 [Hermetia illucens]|nr:R3H and coiled-coil domain-containing protein 1 [Hermetia illucens]
MGVEKNVGEGVSTKNSKTVDIYRPPALRNVQPSNPSLLKAGDSEAAEPSPKSQPPTSDNNVTTETKVQSSSNQTERPIRRERRPDRAVYIPRARRSQTTSPHTNPLKPKVNEMLQSTRNGTVSQKECGKSQSFECAGDNNVRTPKESVPVIPNCDNKAVEKSKNSNEKSTELRLPQNVSDKNCDNFIQNDISNVDSTNVKNQSFREGNITNVNATDNSQTKPPDTSKKTPLIENASLPAKKSEDEKEIHELERMSREINRSSRRIIKQTFNSDVLQIPDNLLPANDQPSKAVDPENDDWDSMFDDNGDCVDPKILSELTASVGKVKIEQPKADYKAYLMKQAILNEEEYPHVLEVSNFPVEFKTQDLMMVFSTYKESGYDIKWVDDTHALAVFSSSRIAAEVLAMGHPFVLLKPLADATVESRAKARKCAASLQPYRPRPETCAALARRLVTGALGVRLKTAAEERENEKKVLREAKERKLLAAKQREEVWES